MRKSRKPKRTSLWLVAIMVLLICGLVTYKRQELNLANAESQARITELKKDIAEEKGEKQEIKKKEAYMQTKKYIEDMAREKLGLVYKDEIIFEPEKK